VGLLGFSAGAATSLKVTQADAEGARPDFVGLIYGPTKEGPVPPHAPPLFAAIAADDRFFGKDGLGLIEAWRRSGASVELHLYSAGGHGFASQPNGATSDGWFDQFAAWLRASKIVANR
jgi:dienelactone hydrolase